MKKKKKLYLHPIPHFQKIQMYHTIRENLVSNLFQFEVVHENNIFWDYAWLHNFGEPNYWLWQVPKHSMQLFSPPPYTTPCLLGEDAKAWKNVCNHNIVCERWQKMASIINGWCDEKLLEILKTKNGRIWNL